MKTGLVLEGGAMRGMFTAGALDVLMEQGVAFDGVMGVSAGAALGCNYKSRQIGRALRYNQRFCRDWRYCSFRSLLLTGDLYGADFAYRRQEVIDYVARKYGADHVCQIITFGTMAAKAAIRDVGRVLGMTYQDTDVVAKAVPFELGMTLEKALKLSPQLYHMYEERPEVQRLINTAMTLEGMPRNASTHAAGVLITGRPVTEYVPVQRNDDVITTQYPKDTIEHLGLLKMDFLGLRTLTVIRDTLDMMRMEGIEMRPEDIPLDDPSVYAMISEGDTDGVFQLEGSGMRSFLTNMKPACFEDIIAAISLYRPGPMESIPRYIQGKQDPSSVRYATELLRPILDVTYVCMVTTP